jgi:hypothetical protein
MRVIHINDKLTISGGVGVCMTYNQKILNMGRFNPLGARFQQAGYGVRSDAA